MAHLLAFQKKRALIQLILWPLEATVGFTLFGLARLLPVGAASALMGWLLSSLAPLTPWQARARRNLAYALPDIDSAEQDRILAGMWNNLGRVIGEYPHVGRLDRLGRVEFVGLDHIKHLDSGGFLIGAHIGNWEVGPLAALKVGKQVSAIYRPLNNPLLASLLERRQMAYGGDIYRKGREQWRTILQLQLYRQKTNPLAPFCWQTHPVLLGGDQGGAMPHSIFLQFY